MINKASLNTVIRTWLLLLASLDTHAGGVSLYEIASDDVGLASAGYGARAEDPFTIYTNPAGMTRLSGQQTALGLQIFFTDVKYSSDEASSILGDNSGNNPIGLLPGGSFFYQHSLSDILKIGIGFYGNSGSVLHYESNWIGRYSALKSTFLGSSIQPTLAYRFGERLSFGAGFVLMNGYLKNTVAIRNSVFEPDYPDAQLKLSDMTWGAGANLGLLYELDPFTRVGITYLTPIKLDFSAAAQFTNLGPTFDALIRDKALINAEVNLGITLPQSLMGSLFHQINAQWAVLASVGWQNWNQFGKVDIGIESKDPVNLTINRDYKDTWHVALGMQHYFTRQCLLNFGIAYDSEFQNASDIPVSVPVNAAWRFGMGTHFPGTRVVDVGISLEYICGGTLDIKHRSLINGEYSGKFKHIGVYFLSFNAVWKCNTQTALFQE